MKKISVLLIISCLFILGCANKSAENISIVNQTTERICGGMFCAPDKIKEIEKNKFVITNGKKTIIFYDVVDCGSNPKVNNIELKDGKYILNLTAEGTMLPECGSDVYKVSVEFSGKLNANDLIINQYSEAFNSTREVYPSNQALENIIKVSKDSPVQ